jgi:hypothetical protein
MAGPIGATGDLTTNAVAEARVGRRQVLSLHWPSSFGHLYVNQVVFGMLASIKRDFSCGYATRLSGWAGDNHLLFFVGIPLGRFADIYPQVGPFGERGLWAYCRAERWGTRSSSGRACFGGGGSMRHPHSRC